MKTRLFIVTLAIFLMGLVAVPASAQNGYLKSLGHSLGENARLKVQNEIYYKAHDANEAAKKEREAKRADKKAENKKHGDQRHMTNSGSGAGWTCPSCGQGGNIGAKCSKCGARKPQATAKAAAGPIFEDTFASEESGLAPSKWKSLSGDALVLDLGEGNVMGIENGSVTPKIAAGALAKGATVSLDFYIWTEGHFKQTFEVEEPEAQKLTVNLTSADAAAPSVMAVIPTLFDGSKDIPVFVKCRAEDRDKKMAADLPNPGMSGWHSMQIVFDGGECNVSIDGGQLTAFKNIVAPSDLVIEAQGLVFVKNVSITK